MRIVVDGVPIRGDNSLRIVSEHLLSAWGQPGSDDELHLVIRAGASVAVPDSVTVHEVPFGRVPLFSRLRTQNVDLPRLCRSVQADILFAILPNTAVTRVPCPRVVMAWDLRYRLRPEQFSRRTLALRRASYAVGFRQADGVACISGRTRRDLLALHPRLARIPVRVTHLGADHVDGWTANAAATTATSPYAIAFGHFGNKNVDLVLQAWAELQRSGTRPVLPLRIVGVPEANRAALRAQVTQAGLTDLVSISPWLPEAGFREQFASSSLVVFPSDFEGFGLPAVEAMRLGIPVVITPDPALLEVTGGNATVVDGEGPEALARAVEQARHTTPESIAAGRRHAASFTWANCATSLRALLADVTAPKRVPGPSRHRRLGAVPARLGAALAAGLLVICGATAVSFALGSSSSHSPPADQATTTIPKASRSGPQAPASDTGATTPSAAPGSRGPAGAPSGKDAGADPAASANSRPVVRSTSGPTTTTSSPPVTVPQMPTPSVTVPTVAVPPPVTVPTSVCSTATTLPCTVTVPGQSCQCP